MRKEMIYAYLVAGETLRLLISTPAARRRDYRTMPADQRATRGGHTGERQDFEATSCGMRVESKICKGLGANEAVEKSC